MPAMELRLQQFIESVQIVSDIDNLNAESPVVLRFYEPDQDITVSVVCSIEEPTNMIIPLNAIWIVFDKESPYYKQALQRTSKNPSSGFAFTWKRLYFYDHVFAEQTYDPADLEGINTDPVGPATESTAGIVLLSQASPTPANPTVISEGHYTLTNDRDPNEHTHPERPAVSFATSSASIPIIDQHNPDIGMALIVGNSGALWRFLDETDINMEL